jgi:hypothetical protein
LVGEAIHSIANLSVVEIQSRSITSSLTTTKVISGGDTLSTVVDTTRRHHGTTVRVLDLVIHSHSLFINIHLFLFCPDSMFLMKLLVIDVSSHFIVVSQLACSSARNEASCSNSSN